MAAPNLPLCEALLDALEAFDRTTAPLGLYACEGYGAGDGPFPRLHQEWHLCLKPRLEELGCRIDRASIRGGAFHFTLPEGVRAEMAFARTSKIKVRKFGSAYRIDPHHQYAERWKELRLGRRIGDLWKPSALAETWVGLRLFLFVGFAGEAEPFEKELTLLRDQLRWNEHGVDYRTRSWPDRYARHFTVRLSVWSRSSDEE